MHGVVDLSHGLVWEIIKTHYTNTSPPVVYKDLVILGNGVGDRLAYKHDPPGDVRAFDARTGKQVWSFHTIPQAGELGNDTWGNDSWKFTGHTNIWAPMTLDEARGLVYLPGTTPSNDFYGGRRPGANLFAESLICLDANTGRRKWHFQIVHHGLWDYDNPSPPNLVTIHVDGRTIDAVVQLTKQGFAYRVRSRHRRAGLADRGAARAGERRRRRARLADAAVPDAAAGVHRAGRDARRCLRPDAGAEGGGAGRDEEVPDRSAVHAAERRRARSSGPGSSAARTGAAARSIRPPASST